MHKHLTIMFTDLKDFTARTSRISRSSMSKMMASHDKLLKPTFAKFGGKIIKTIGDAFLVVFESPTNAVLCGIYIQEALRDHNANVSQDEKIQVRVAVNSGEVEIRDNDIFGEAVNIAARIEGITSENEIYFTEAVYLAMNKAEVPSSEVGFKRLKGIPHEIKVYKVIREKTRDWYNDFVSSDENKNSFNEDENQIFSQKAISSNSELFEERKNTSWANLAAKIVLLALTIILLTGVYFKFTGLQIKLEKKMVQTETTDSDKVLSKSDNPKITLNFKAVELKKVFRMISKLSGFTIVLHKNVDWNYDCNFKELPALDVIRSICIANDLELTEKGKILYINPKKAR